jgi:hypothetical protein
MSSAALRAAAIRAGKAAVEKLGLPRIVHRPGCPSRGGPDAPFCDFYSSNVLECDEEPHPVIPPTWGEIMVVSDHDPRELEMKHDPRVEIENHR